MGYDAQVRYVEGILGPHEVGVLVAVFLFGLVTIQAYTYFRCYPDDRRGNKLLVTFIWILLAAHTIISSFALYKRTVIEFGTMENLEQYPDAMCGAFSISGLIGALVQSFFAYRLHKFSAKWAIPVICWALSLARLGSVLCLSVTACQASSPNIYVQQYKWLVILAMSVSAVVDVIIAGALSHYLWIRRNEFLKPSQKVVDKIIACTIQTGLLTSFSSILMLILYLTVKNFAWVAAYLIISGVFANYLLVSLNARQDFRDGMNRKPTFLDVETLRDADQLPYPLPTMNGIGPNGTGHPQFVCEPAMSGPTVIESSERRSHVGRPISLRHSIEGSQNSSHAEKLYIITPVVL